MAFVATDPRTKLAGDAPAVTDGEFGSADYVKFYETLPQISTELESTWLVRGQNFVIAYSEVATGAELRRSDQSQEYMVLLADSDGLVDVLTSTEKATAAGRRIVIVPPGPSNITVAKSGRVVRIFGDASTDLADAAANASSYVTRKPNLPPFDAWPEPPDGYRLRSYPLDVTPEEGRFGRIWRCTTAMVNFTEPRMGPRDVTRMSPHVHADFEQASLVLDGAFVHHIRWPWGTDMRHWRPDEHEICAGPSVAIIPPGSIHTSQQVSQDLNQLVDIFAPPRMDFSQMPGWVLNGEEYPLPAPGQR
jgi:hypothetical protein